MVAQARAGHPSACRASAQAIFVASIVSVQSSPNAVASSCVWGGGRLDDAPVRQPMGQQLAKASGARQADIVRQPHGLLLESSRLVRILLLLLQLLLLLLKLLRLL